MNREQSLFTRIITALIVSLIAASMLLPLINVLALSFSTDIDSSNKGLLLWPSEFSLSGYVSLFGRVNILRPLLISFWVTFWGTLCHVLVCTLAAYVLLKKDLPGKKIIAALVILPMMIPFEMLFIPVYTVMKNLQLTNTLNSLILIRMADTFSILLMRNYLEKVPPSLEESAAMDGAGEILVFFKIYLPIALPGMAAVTIFQAVIRWNMFFEVVLFINDTALYTLQRALNTLIGGDITFSTQIITNNTRMAGVVIAILPLMILFLFLQKFFISGLSQGAVKDS